MKNFIAPLLFVALSPALSCRPARAPAAESAREIVIVAPHPDDETLIAGGILEAARSRGARVAVIIVTNGDFTCERDGHVREGESVAALASLGVAEEDVHFLGYPDGWLPELGDEPLPPIERRAVDHSCAKESGTYAERGAAHRDEHSFRTGAAGTYDSRSLEEDLAALLRRLQPHDVYVTHPLDTHPDHAATYAYLRRAIDRLGGVPPHLHRAIVHAGACWPNGRDLAEPCPVIGVHDLRSPTPPLPDPYARYLPRERPAVPDPVRKLAAIGAYVSQLGTDPDHDWLTTFARADEPFYPEELTCAGGHCSATSTPATRVTLSAQAPGADVGAYHLELDPTGEKIALTRGDRLFRRWTLPLSGRAIAHVFDLTVATRSEDRAIEISLVRDGSFLGIAIDEAPAGGG
jgi:LmbE family N-acetylglucosaminyl deacetylase